MGSGLVIVNTIIQRHKGHIKVESTVGKGSTFLVTLPTNLHENREES
jgi:OmpR-family two-component system manganese-sensing sensor histidine kinase